MRLFLVDIYSSSEVEECYVVAEDVPAAFVFMTAKLAEWEWAHSSIGAVHLLGEAVESGYGVTIGVQNVKALLVASPYTELRVLLQAELEGAEAYADGMSPGDWPDYTHGLRKALDILAGIEGRQP